MATVDRSLEQNAQYLYLRKSLQKRIDEFSAFNTLMEAATRDADPQDRWQGIKTFQKNGNIPEPKAGMTGFTDGKYAEPQKTPYEPVMYAEVPSTADAWKQQHNPYKGQEQRLLRQARLVGDLNTPLAKLAQEKLRLVALTDGWLDTASIYTTAVDYVRNENSKKGLVRRVQGAQDTAQQALINAQICLNRLSQLQISSFKNK